MLTHSRNESHTSDSVQTLEDRPDRRMGNPALALLVAVTVMLLPARVNAQQTQLDLHGNLAVGTSSHNKSWAPARACRSRSAVSP